MAVQNASLSYKHGHSEGYKGVLVRPFRLSNNMRAP